MAIVKIPEYNLFWGVWTSITLCSGRVGKDSEQQRSVSVICKVYLFPIWTKAVVLEICFDQLVICGVILLSQLC